jgi:hypothetical protein
MGAVLLRVRRVKDRASVLNIFELHRTADRVLWCDLDGRQRFAVRLEKISAVRFKHVQHWSVPSNIGRCLAACVSRQGERIRRGGAPWSSYAVLTDRD